MAINAYLNFKGNCREAVNFYKDVFETEKPNFRTFGELPQNPEYPLPEEYKQCIMHTKLMICGDLVMFSDIFPGQPYVLGNNISLTVVVDEKDKLCAYFNKLKEGGEVEMDLQETEWSKCYGSLKDKFGIGWQFNYGISH